MCVFEFIVVNVFVGYGYFFCLNLDWMRFELKVEILYLFVYDSLN